MHVTFLLLVALLGLYPVPGNCSCCFGFRKICESVSDVPNHGTTDWTSLVIMPRGCENSTLKPEVETITQHTFEIVPELTNVYIVDKLVQFQENCFQPLKNLIYLSIIQNNMNTIPKGVFKDLLKLKKLVLRDSKIEKVTKDAFYNLPKLEVLLLSGNIIREIKSGIVNSVETKTIDLSFNLITKIELNSFPNNLILLNLKKNNIQEIDDNTFLNLNSLEMLILSKNKIRSIRKGTFKGLSNLSKLDLSRNEIDTIEKDTFSDLHELMFLYLKYNKLQTINPDVFLKDMINLTDLELDQNKLNYLDEKLFQRMPNLDEISLNGNPWYCTCLQQIINILHNKSISISTTTDDLRPKCFDNKQTCVYA